MGFQELYSNYLQLLMLTVFGAFFWYHASPSSCYRENQTSELDLYTHYKALCFLKELQF